jgi:hypothetical protein
MTKSRNIAFLIFLILIDQLSKYIIRTSGGFYICNEGMAFGMNYFWIFPIILIFIMLLVIFQITNYQLLITNKISKSKYQIWKLDIGHFIRNWKLEIRNYKNIHLPLSLILAGGISNLIDRLYFGCIIDFIDLQIWPVFNFADIYITIGAIAILMEILNIKNKNDNEKSKNVGIIK